MTGRNLQGSMMAVACLVSIGLVTGCSEPGDSSTGATPATTATSEDASTPTETGPDPGPNALDVGNGPTLSGEPIVSTDEDAQPGEIRSLVRSIPVDTDVRYAGFDIYVETVDVGFDPAGFAVAYVAMSQINNTPRADLLQTAIEIASQGQVFEIDRDFSSDVPSEGTAPAAVSIRLDPDTFSFDDAVLFIGRADRQRVEVPLGETGELVTRVPIPLAAGETARDDVSSIAIEQIVVAWDSADPRAQAEPGQAFIHLTITLDSAVETAVNARSTALVLADGTEITPEAATIGQVAAGEPFAIAASYLVADPPMGDYVLRYTERFDRGVVDVPFSIIIES